MNRNGKAPPDVGPVSNGLGVASLDVAATSQGVGTAPQSVGVASLDVAATPQDVATTPQSVGTTPQSVAATPQSMGTTPQGVGTTPQDVAATPQPPSKPARRRRVAFSSNASIAQRLATAQIAIDTILAAPDLQALMAAQGYDTARMQHGQALCAQALTLCQQQHAKYGALYAATDARGAAHAQANATYTRHVKLAKIALRDNRGAAQKIGLAAPRTRTLAGWLLQAQQFYANALADTAIIGALAKYGVTQAQLVDGQQLVATVIAGAVAQQTQKGAAQATTQARDVALVALNHWMRDFMAIARIALAGHPQRLALLGLGAAA